MTWLNCQSWKLNQPFWDESRIIFSVSVSILSSRAPALIMSQLVRVKLVVLVVAIFSVAEIGFFHSCEAE